MAKKKQTQPEWMSQRRSQDRSKKRLAKPDEVLRLPGGVTFVRTGRLVEIRTDRTPEEQAALLQALRASFPKLIERVQRAVDTCEALIPQFDPAQLLQKAFFDVAQSHMGMETESSLGPHAGSAMRVLEYLQAAIVALTPAAQQRMFSEEEWETLANAIHEIYNVLNRDWLVAESATRRDDTGGGPKFEDLRAWLFMVWFGIRGARYNVHEREHLFRLLEVHDAELLKLYGVGAAQIADSTQELVARLTKGHGEAFLTARAIHEATFSDENMAKVDMAAVSSERELLQRLVDATGRRAELDEALARTFGLDLFDITEISAASAFDALALESGADTSFFGPGDHRGWPLRSMPTWFKPFMRLNGRLFCFYPYFVDNLYRAISRDVRARDKHYETSWKDGQTAVSERWAAEILRQLLPGVAVTNSAYYIASDGRLCECDAILTVDELLVVLEVKGGALAYTDPTGDLDAHLKSIEALILAPAGQAERFVAALESAGELALYTQDRSPVRTIRRSQFRTVLRCAVPRVNYKAPCATIRNVLFATA